jgi:hypothetical protein
MCSALTTQPAFVCQFWNFFGQFVRPFTMNKATLHPPPPLQRNKYGGTCSCRAELGWVKHSPILSYTFLLRRRNILDFCVSTHDWLQLRGMTAVGERLLRALPPETNVLVLQQLWKTSTRMRYCGNLPILALITDGWSSTHTCFFVSASYIKICHRIKSARTTVVLAQ